MVSKTQGERKDGFINHGFRVFVMEVEKDFHLDGLQR